MINFFFENIEPFLITEHTKDWLGNLITTENKKTGTINYIICDDDYLLNINQTHLKHDDYTDIITFDYVKGNNISGDIFVSLPRILENSKIYSKDFNAELHRVLAHGVLHLCGYKDKTDADQKIMRQKEDFYLLLLNK